MTSHSAINDALDSLDEESGLVQAEVSGGQASVDVVSVDRLGVKVREIRVQRKEPFDMIAECESLPDRIRSWGERVLSDGEIVGEVTTSET